MSIMGVVIDINSRRGIGIINGKGMLYCFDNCFNLCFNGVRGNVWFNGVFSWF